MIKLNSNELREQLVGQEMSLMMLDDFMSSNGYYTVFNDGATRNIKSDLCVVFTALDTNECEIIVHFEIILENGEDEIEESFILKVTSVEEF